MPAGGEPKTRPDPCQTLAVACQGWHGEIVNAATLNCLPAPKHSSPWACQQTGNQRTPYLASSAGMCSLLSSSYLQRTSPKPDLTLVRPWQLPTSRQLGHTQRHTSSVMEEGSQVGRHPIPTGYVGALLGCSSCQE